MIRPIKKLIGTHTFYMHRICLFSILNKICSWHHLAISTIVISWIMFKRSIRVFFSCFEILLILLLFWWIVGRNRVTNETTISDIDESCIGMWIVLSSFVQRLSDIDFRFWRIKVMLFIEVTFPGLVSCWVIIVGSVTIETAHERVSIDLIEVHSLNFF